MPVLKIYTINIIVTVRAVPLILKHCFDNMNKDFLNKCMCQGLIE